MNTKATLLDIVERAISTRPARASLTRGSGSVRLALCAIALMGAASPALADRPLSVIVDAPWFIQYKVEVFYEGDALPFYSAYMGGGAGINFGSTANRPFFVRIQTFQNVWYGVRARTDQTVAFVFVDPSRQGILWVRPGKDYLAPSYTNLRRR